jgi:hypothetical protein
MLQKANADRAFSLLKTTLSKLYPVEHWTMSTTADAVYPFAPRFCWAFFRADPEMLGRLAEALRNYKGSMSWVFGPAPANTLCLVAAEPGSNQFVGYPPVSRSGALSAKEGAEQLSGPTEEFIDQAVTDVPYLCFYLEQCLGLEQLPPKSFDPQLIAPLDPPSVESAPFDFVERGMHVAWIVYGVTTESREGKGNGPFDRRMLHFSVTAEEWRRIDADTLDETYRPSGVTRSETGSFPFLAKIQEHESAYFRGVEVEALRQECLRARARTSTPLAIRGLDKLILLCSWAQHTAGDILLRAP